MAATHYVQMAQASNSPARSWACSVVCPKRLFDSYSKQACFWKETSWTLLRRSHHDLSLEAEGVGGPAVALVVAARSKHGQQGAPGELRNSVEQQCSRAARMHPPWQPAGS